MSPKTAISSILTESEPVEAEGRKTIDHLPTSAANQQDDRQNEQRLADPAELALNLNHSTRDQLFTSLNQLSSILQCSTPIPEDAKQRIRRRIDESVQLLMDLSPFEASRQLADAPGVFEERIAGLLTVRLSVAQRLKVIGHLIAIRDAVQFDGLIADVTKRALVAENRRTIEQLLDLPGGEQSGQSEELKIENKGLDDESFQRKRASRFQ